MNTNLDDKTTFYKMHKYVFFLAAILRLFVLYGGIYLICTYVSDTQLRPATDSLGGEGAGVVFIMIVLSIIWTVIWYFIMFTLIAREKNRKSSFEKYAEIFTLFFPLLTLILSAVYILTQT